jgi:hypothetical protein
LLHKMAVGKRQFELSSWRGGGTFPVKFHTKWLLWHVHVHFDCAGSHKTLAPG